MRSCAEPFVVVVGRLVGGRRFGRLVDLVGIEVVGLGLVRTLVDLVLVEHPSLVVLDHPSLEVVLEHPSLEVVLKHRTVVERPSLANLEHRTVLVHPSLVILGLRTILEHPSSVATASYLVLLVLVEESKHSNHCSSMGPFIFSI